MKFISSISTFIIPSCIAFLVSFICGISCKKSDSQSGGDTSTPPPQVTYSVDSNITQPGLIVTLKASQNITRDTCTVQFGPKSIFLVQIDSFHYSFLTPVLSAGTYTLNLSSINSINNPEIVIRSYAAISNPDAVITELIQDYNRFADSLLINSTNNNITISDATFMHQLMEQLTQNIALCTPDEKLSLAYQFQNMPIDKSFVKNANLDTAYLASRMNDPADEISSIMTSLALLGSRNTLAATLSAAAVVVTGTAVIKAPGPLKLVAVISFAIAVSRFVYYIKAAIKNHGEATDLTGVAFDNLSELNGNGTNGNPVSISNNQSIFQQIKSKFRTMRKSDEMGLNNEISDFIKGTNALEEKDKSIKSIFDNIKSLFSSYFDKITVNYSPYVSPVLIVPKQKTTGVKAEFIKVNSVSNPNISVAAVDNGSNNLKLTFTNPSNNITTQTNFSFQLKYTQAAINNTTTVTEQAVFNPAVDTFIYVAHYWVPGTIVNNTITLKLHFDNGAITGRGLITSYPLWGTVTGTFTGTSMILYFDYDNGVTPACNLVQQPPPACPVCQLQIFPGGTYGIKELWTISGTTNADHSVFNGSYIRLYTTTQIIGNSDCTFTSFVQNSTENGNFTY